MERRTHALLLSYDGAPFRGWQRQPGLATVQGAVEDALASLLGAEVQVHGAARTDAGVHAEGQVASFSLRAPVETFRLELPAGLRLVEHTPAHPSFHARASARAKRYRYRFAWGAPGERAFHLGAAARPRWDLAREALGALAGLPAISGLASPARGSKPAPPLSRWSLEEDGQQAVLTVEAPAFRKHQIRNLAGHLAAVALGLAAPGTLADLAKRRRPWMGATAPPHGLTLLEVLYPPELNPFKRAGAG